MSRTIGSRLVILSMLLLLAGVHVFADDQEYKVQAGDTLSSIARNFHLKPGELQSYNNIKDPGLIKPGQILRIPVKDSPAEKKDTPDAAAKVHKTQKGEGLMSIARKYGLGLSALLAVNPGFTKDTKLKLGQEVKIPGSAKAAPTQTSPRSDQVAEASAPPRPSPAPESVTRPQKTSQADAPSDSMLGLSGYRGQKNIAWPAQGLQFSSGGKYPGILIKTQAGDEIHAVSAGTVTYLGPHSIYGQVVFVTASNGYIFIYGGNEDTKLNMNQTVKPGDLIGKVGLSPGLKEYFAYFSVWKNGKYIDPSQAPRT